MTYSKGYVLSSIKRIVKSIDRRAMVQLNDPSGLKVSQHLQSWDILVIPNKEASANKRLEIQLKLLRFTTEMNQKINTKFADIQKWKRSSKGLYMLERTKAEAIIL